jgi:hypothetical protein
MADIKKIPKPAADKKNILIDLARSDILPISMIVGGVVTASVGVANNLNSQGSTIFLEQEAVIANDGKPHFIAGHVIQAIAQAYDQITGPVGGSFVLDGRTQFGLLYNSTMSFFHNTKGDFVGYTSNGVDAFKQVNDTAMHYIVNTYYQLNTAVGNVSVSFLPEGSYYKDGVTYLHVIVTSQQITPPHHDATLVFVGTAMALVGLGWAYLNLRAAQRDAAKAKSAEKTEEQ